METTTSEMTSLQMETYSLDTQGQEKSFVVFGPETKTHKVSLKNLGGRFNGRLKIVGSFSKREFDLIT